MASPANFEATPTSFGVFIHNTKINYGRLYLRQVISGSGTNQSDVIEPNAATGLGQTTVNNWEIYDGLGSDAKLVAYGQGMHTYAGNWQNWFTMVFETERLKGSTLQIMGASLEKSNDWAIVGGTGDFAMAQGVIKRTEYKFTGDEKIHELTIDGYCRIELPAVPAPTKMGPWGGYGGFVREMEGKSRRLESVTIRHANLVERLTFSYVNEDGQIRTAGPFGSAHADSSTPQSIITKITFGPSEFVQRITGAGVVTALSALTIVTNVKTYGPFGTRTGTLFNAPVPSDKTVVGFFVQADNNTVTTIGVYTI